MRITTKNVLTIPPQPPLPPKKKLISSGVTMRCRKIRRNLGHHVPNKLLSPEDFTHHVMLLFYPFSDENELLSDCPPLYQYKIQEQGVQDAVTGNKIQEQGVQDAVTGNKIKFEPYGDLVDQAFSQFNENSINNQDSHSQIENDETPGAEYPNENDSEDTE